jgi:hypothetical protein
MGITFSDVTFRNLNGIAVELTIEAPIGTVAIGPTTVGPSSAVTLHPRVTDCLSASLTVDERTHGTERQNFILEPTGSPQQIFLESITVDYRIGGFQGSCTTLIR